MQIPAPFIKLPFRLDTERLLKEVRQFSREEWRRERHDTQGYWALNLNSYGGWDCDWMDFPMLPTQRLSRCPYIRQVIALLGAPIAEVRLRWLELPGEVHEHFDDNYYGFRRIRTHVSVTSDPTAIFGCGNESVHMDPGEMWVFDRLLPHKVSKSGGADRIHLTIDTVGSPNFWALLNSGQSLADISRNGPKEPKYIPFDPNSDPAFCTELVPNSPILPYAEVDYFLLQLLEYWKEWPGVDARLFSEISKELDQFRSAWASAWVQHGAAEAAWPKYRELCNKTYLALRAIPGNSESPQWSPMIRLYTFLLSGACSPNNGLWTRPLKQSEILISRFRIAQEILFRLTPEGDLSLRTGSNDYRQSSLAEFKFLASLRPQLNLLEHSKRAGFHEEAPSLSQYMESLLAEGILIKEELPLPTPPVPAIDERPGEKSTTPVEDRTESEPENSDRLDRPMRLTQTTYFRLTVRRELIIWAPEQSTYKKANLLVLLILMGLAKRNSLAEAAAHAGVTHDSTVDQVGEGSVESRNSQLSLKEIQMTAAIQTLLEKKHLKNLAYYEEGDRETFDQLFRLLQSHGYSVNESRNKILKLVPTFDQFAWRAWMTELTGCIHSKDGGINAYEVPHQGIHVLIGLKYGWEYKRRPLTTLISEGLAGAVEVYFECSRIANRGAVDPDSSVLQRFFRNEAACGIAVQSLISEGVSDPFALFRKVALDEVRICQILLSEHVRLCEGKESDPNSIFARLREIKTIPLIHHKNFVNFVLFMVSICGTESDETDLSNFSTCESALNSSSTFEEFLQHLQIEKMIRLSNEKREAQAVRMT